MDKHLQIILIEQQPPGKGTAPLSLAAVQSLSVHRNARDPPPSASISCWPYSVSFEDLSTWHYTVQNCTAVLPIILGGKSNIQEKRNVERKP